MLTRSRKNKSARRTITMVRRAELGGIDTKSDDRNNKGNRNGCVAKINWCQPHILYPRM